MKIAKLIGACALLIITACSQENAPTSAALVDDNKLGDETFTIIIGDAEVGYIKVDRSGEDVAIDYDFKNNGRGPTLKESISFDDYGIPVAWSISGTTTFGAQADESFSLEAGSASWIDATGKGAATISTPSLYVSQFGSPYSAFIYARALLNAPDLSLPALPGGALSLAEMEQLTVAGENGEEAITTYALSGANLNPSYFILDDEERFFAFITPRFIAIREGFEGEQERLRGLSAKYAAERYEEIQAKVAHNYDAPIRIRNVRIFEPETLSMSDAVSVVVADGRIQSIDSLTIATGADEVEIDGAGGSLVAGLYDMHGHMSDNAALLNVTAGVTSVRDMGNDTAVLSSLIEKIDDGTLAGPRITRSGFIEGKSPYSSNNGILVESEEEAIAAVREYSDQGFYQIKLYNSMNGDWASAIIAEADRLGMPVMGHVPAFSNANAMIRAGFDEMTHINQVMLGWVLEEGEDTRTLLRLTALKRLPDLDLQSAPVQETLDLMVANNVGIDPTLAIHEFLMLSRNGETRIGVLDYIDHMPANVQRNAKVALANIETPEEDVAYRGAYEKIVETLRMMKDRGIFIVAGTDLGGALELHRELELYQDLGFTGPEVLKRATYDVAEYMGQDDELGSIEVGKLADFFVVPGDPVEDLKAIKTISLVSRGGVFYYPSEIYPEFGITPFTDIPTIRTPSE